MIIKCNNKEFPLVICNSFFSRLKGFMFYKKDITYALLFKKCKSIHTFFMYQDISVIFTDKDNKVLAYYPIITPNKILIGPKKTTNTYELSPCFFKEDIINKIIEIKK